MVDANGLPMLDFSYDLPANHNLRDEGIPGGSVWDSLETYDINQACTAYNPAQPFTDLAFVSLKINNKGNDPITTPSCWMLVWTEDNSKPVDPRLDWTVGRRGIPYWDWGVHTGSDGSVINLMQDLIARKNRFIKNPMRGNTQKLATGHQDLQQMDTE